jgi:hypothetical protein
MAREPCQSFAAGTQPCAASLIACMERKKSAHPVDPKASCVTRRRTSDASLILGDVACISASSEYPTETGLPG